MQNKKCRKPFATPIMKVFVRRLFTMQHLMCFMVNNFLLIVKSHSVHLYKTICLKQCGINKDLSEICFSITANCDKESTTTFSFTDSRIPYTALRMTG